MAEAQLPKQVFSGFLRNVGACVRIVWREKKAWLLITLGLVGVLAATLPYARSAFNASLINELVKVAGGGVFTDVIILALAAMMGLDYVVQGLGSLRARLNYMFTLALDRLSDEMVLRKKTFLDIASHEDPKVQDLINKLDEEGTWRLREFVREGLVMLDAVFSLVVSLSIISVMNVWIFLLVVAGALPDLLVEKKHGGLRWIQRTKRSQNRRRYWDLRRHFSAIASLIEMEVFKNGKFFWERVRENRLGFDNEDLKLEGNRLRDQYVSRLTTQTTVAITTVYFVWQVLLGKMEIGTMAFVLGAIAGFRGALVSLFASVGRSYQHSLFVSDLFRFLALEPKLKIPADAVRLPENATPEILFENVTFGYAEGPDVLKNITLKIAPGEKLAIVGINGSGKTTLIKLLCGFYRPRSGRISVGGVELEKVHPDSWHDFLTVIMQNYANYRFEVREAIAVGKTSEAINDARVEKAAVDSDSETFIKEWPKGYYQPLGKQFDEGVEPSGGQWQKLALARLFYRDSRVLVLDEPTSSIDAEAESKIFEKLEALPKDRTVVLISHRFSTVRQADRIALIEGGELKELGSHEELLALGGTYSRLFNLQAKGYQ